jgi:hypothetical protein
MGNRTMNFRANGQEVARDWLNEQLLAFTNQRLKVLEHGRLPLRNRGPLPQILCGRGQQGYPTRGSAGHRRGQMASWIFVGARRRFRPRKNYKNDSEKYDGEGKGNRQGVPELGSNSLRRIP